MAMYCLKDNPEKARGKYLDMPTMSFLDSIIRFCITHIKM